MYVVGALQMLTETSAAARSGWPDIDGEKNLKKEGARVTEKTGANTELTGHEPQRHTTHSDVGAQLRLGLASHWQPAAVEHPLR